MLKAERRIKQKKVRDAMSAFGWTVLCFKQVAGGNTQRLGEIVGIRVFE